MQLYSKIQLLLIFLIVSVYLVACDSSQFEQANQSTLTSDSRPATATLTLAEPSLSSNNYHPNGKEQQLQLTFISDRNEGYWGIYAIDVGCLEEVLPCIGEPYLVYEFPSRVRFVNWSPDGHYAVFDSKGIDGKRDIFVYEENGEAINITSSSDNENFPSWTPDGKKIIYQHNRDTPYGDIPEIIESTIDGQNTTKLIDPAGLYSLAYPVISPDGEKMIFSAKTEDALFAQLFMTDLETLDTVRITNSDYHENVAKFSPDGKRIVYIQSNLTHDTSLMVMDLESQEPVILIDEEQGGSWPAWSPASNWIAFVSGNKDSDIYIINIKTREQTQIVDWASVDTFPAWRLIE